MLVEKVLSTIEKFGMFSEGDLVVAAVSGGVDSVVMLHALHSLKDRLRIDLHVAHLNHGIRGTDADEDEKFVIDLAIKFNTPYTTRKVDIPALSKEWKMGTEEAARKARYQFLNDVADRTGARRIATAHTASDQAETVVMNILRGSGIEGLGGIPPVRGRIVRPLIESFRWEVEEYQKYFNLVYREDATNIEPEYTRNRIRHQLLPLLREYNPRVDDALAKLSETAREDNELIEVVVKEAYDKLHHRQDDIIEFNLSLFRSQPLAVQRRLLRKAVSELTGSLTDIGFTHVENLLERLHSPGVYEVELPSGKARVRKTDDSVSVYLIKPHTEAPKVSIRTLDIPGVVEIPELKILVKAEPAAADVDWKRPRNSPDIVVDAQKIHGHLAVRTWIPGDRMVPLGMTRPKKLQDLFIDRKVPKDERHRIPVICDEDKIIWVAGVVISQDAAVTDRTKEYLRLSVMRIHE